MVRAIVQVARTLGSDVFVERGVEGKPSARRDNAMVLVLVVPFYGDGV